MAIINMDGFDNYNIVGGDLTSDSFPGIGYTVDATATGLVKVTDGAKTGSKAVQIARSTSAHATLKKQVTTTANIVCIGFAFNATGRDTLMSITDVVNVVWANGKPVINTVEAKNTPILNTWYYAEFVINKTDNTINYKLNGYDQFDAPVALGDGITLPETFELVWGFGANGTGALFRLDDLYITSDVPLGTMAISTRLPQANGTVSWNPVPGEKANFEILARVPADTSEYVESSTAGSRDTYVNNDEVTGSKILAVGVSVLASKTDVDDQALSLVLVNGENELVSEGKTLSLDYNYLQAFFETNTAGTEWQPEDVATTQFGFEMK